jgi:hypothetical protein
MPPPDLDDQEPRASDDPPDSQLEMYPLVPLEPPSLPTHLSRPHYDLRSERSEPILTDLELLKIARHQFRATMLGDRAQHAQSRVLHMVEVLDQIVNDPTSKQRVQALALAHKILTVDQDAEDARPQGPTVQIHQAFVGSPQDLARLEQLQLEADAKKRALLIEFLDDETEPEPEPELEESP